MNLVVPIIAAAGLAFLGYVFLERLGPKGLLPATCRAVGWSAIALLVLNPSCQIPSIADRPLVLLDASLSMTAVGGRWEEARGAAMETGDVRTFGDPARTSDSLPVAGRSLLAEAIAAAAASGRALVVMTDGEIGDVPTVAVDLLRQSTIRLFPRSPGPAVAVRAVTGPDRVILRDSILLRVQVLVAGEVEGTAAAGSLSLLTRQGDRIVARTTLNIAGASSREAQMVVPASALGPGEHLLEVAIVDAVGGEQRDDVRLHYVRVADTPGVVLVASPGDWEARFLYRTIRDVTSLPVEGFVELEAGRWRRMSDLAGVTPERVRDAYRSADVGVRYGAPTPIATRPRAEWLWPSQPSARIAGDWYVSAGGASPLGEALAAWSVDSFAPATSVLEDTVPPGAWVALTARLRRRGAPRPVIFGHQMGGRREITSLGRGLWRWAFRGDASEQAYRALVASSVDWLLGAEASDGGGIVLNRRVVPRGLPLIFSRVAGNEAAPTVVPIRFQPEDEGMLIEDSLRFTGVGTASVYLEPGVYRYSFPGANGAMPGTGLAAVEVYSEEWFPRAVTLTAHSAAASRQGGRRGTRETLWPFGVAIAALTAEWVVRRRRGLR